MPTLSVVVPSHRRADLLRECLTSLAAFAPPGTEVVVVDDASPGGTVTHAARDFPDVRVVTLPKRSGFCRAANAGIRATAGDIVELLNDDAAVTAGWAEAALAHFADPRVGSFAPLVLQRGPASSVVRVDSAGDGYDPGGFAFKVGHGRPLAALTLTAGPAWGASASSAFYRRAALDAVGLFPGHFGAYFEDVDLAFRFNRGGWACRFDPASVVWHRVSASYGASPRRRGVESQSCNEERVWWRNTRGRDRLRLLPRHLAVLAGKAARRISEGGLAPWLAGRGRAWAGL